MSSMGRAGLLFRGELGELLVGIVAAEADAVVPGRRCARGSFCLSAMRIRWGLWQVGQVILSARSAMHRLFELGFDQGGFLGVAVGAGAGRFPGVGRMRGVRHSLRCGTWCTTASGGRTGRKVSGCCNRPAQFPEIETFLRRSLQSFRGVAGKTLGVGRTLFLPAVRGVSGRSCAMTAGAIAPASNSHPNAAKLLTKESGIASPNPSESLIT